MSNPDYISQPGPSHDRGRGGLSKREIALIVVIALAVVFVGWFAWSKDKSVNSFEECVAAGNPVMESWPEQCRAGDRTFTRPGLVLPGQETGSEQKPISREDAIVATAFNHCRNQGTANEQQARAIIARNMQDKSLYVSADNFVRITMSCAEGQASFRLFMREDSDSGWAILGATQEEVPGCSWLDGTGVPEVIAAQCVGRDGQKRAIQPGS